MASITVAAKAENLQAVYDLIVPHIVARGHDEKSIKHCKICVEEIFLNIAANAYAPGEGDVEVSMEDVQDGVVITFTDSGKAFNPLMKENPDVDAPLAERPIGGLGIYIVKKAMDGVEYKRLDGKNILTMLLKKNHFLKKMK